MHIDQKIKNMEMLRDVVMRAPAEGFDIDTFGVDFYGCASRKTPFELEETACGTAACIAGWAAVSDEFGQELFAIFAKRVNEYEFVTEFSAMHEVTGVDTTVHLPARSGERIVFTYREDYLYSGNDDRRFYDDTYLVNRPTPAENDLLGRAYANGLADKISAIQRIDIVLHALRLQRAAIAREAGAMVVACDAS